MNKNDFKSHFSYSKAKGEPKAGIRRHRCGGGRALPVTGQTVTSPVLTFTGIHSTETQESHLQPSRLWPVPCVATCTEASNPRERQLGPDRRRMAAAAADTRATHGLLGHWWLWGPAEQTLPDSVRALSTMALPSGQTMILVPPERHEPLRPLPLGPLKFV